MASYLYRTAQPFTLATFRSWGSSTGAGRIRLAAANIIQNEQPAIHEHLEMVTESGFISPRIYGSSANQLIGPAIKRFVIHQDRVGILCFKIISINFLAVCNVVFICKDIAF
jgi:hypothetical protein